MIKRKAYGNMLTWKLQNNNEALFVTGARCTGKTKLCEYFCKKKFKSYIRIDFRNISKEIKNIFEEDTYDLDLFFIKLSNFYKTKLYENDSVIILDEIHNVKNVDTIIKFILDDGRYNVIATSSKLYRTEDTKIRYKKKTINLNPLDFEEFLSANAGEATTALLKTSFKEKRPLGKSLHKKILNDFAIYMLVGGMPEAVNKYVETRELEKVDNIKKQILNIYNNDIKISNDRHLEKIFAIYNEIPNELTAKNKTFKISSIDKKARFREYEKAFFHLVNNGIISIDYNSHEPIDELIQSKEFFTRRCYMKDTGLLVTKFAHENYHDNILYTDTLLGNIYTHHGMLTKNAISQALYTNNYNSFFYTRVDKNNRKNHIEIDFLIKDNYGISAIEVKNAGFRKNSSIDKLRMKFDKNIRNYYVLNLDDLKIINTSNEAPIGTEIIQLPIYMAFLL